MNTHNVNVNTATPESPKTWGNGPKICVSANDLRTRWHTTNADGKNVTPSEGKHYPARNGSYGVDALLLDEADVVALLAAGHTSLPRLAGSGRGMTALYDLGENAGCVTSLPAVARSFTAQRHGRRLAGNIYVAPHQCWQKRRKRFLTVFTLRAMRAWIITGQATSRAGSSPWKTPLTRRLKIR